MRAEGKPVTTQLLENPFPQIHCMVFVHQQAQHENRTLLDWILSFQHLCQGRAHAASILIAMALTLGAPVAGHAAQASVNLQTTLGFPTPFVQRAGRR
jgi:hypothetical protein